MRYGLNLIVIALHVKPISGVLHLFALSIVWPDKDQVKMAGKMCRCNLGARLLASGGSYHALIDCIDSIAW